MKDEEIIEILSDQNFWYKDIETGIHTVPITSPHTLIVELKHPQEQEIIVYSTSD